jgi:hypothetical protein
MSPILLLYVHASFAENIRDRRLKILQDQLS